MNHAILRAFVLASALVTWTCVTTLGCAQLQVIDIDASDEDGISPGLKASWAFFPRGGPPRQGLFERPAATRLDEAPHPVAREAENAQAGDGPLVVSTTPHATSVGATAFAGEEPMTRRRFPLQPTLSANFEYSAGIGGNDAENVAGTQYVDYDGTKFLGPQRLQYNYDLQLGSIGVRGGGRLFDLFSLEGMAGLSTSALDLKIRSAGQRAGDTSVAIGAHFGARATLTPHPVVDFYTQWQMHLLGGLQSRHGRVVLTTSELGTNLHLTSNLSLFGGWRWWSYEESINRASDLNVQLSGPTFGLLFRF